MFTDNTNLFISGINVDDLFSDKNCGLDEISIWFKANKLSLNLQKQVIIYFTISPAIIFIIF